MSDPIKTKRAAHHCPDWDFAFIRPDDPEMECCICTIDDEPTRKAALYPHETEAEENAR